MNEFNIISTYFAPLTKGEAGTFGLTDDAATLQVSEGHELVLTKDAITEGTHFLEGDEPFNLARKLMRVNLSDLAAMGAKPKAYMLAVILPRHTEEFWIKQFTDGLMADSIAYGLHLVGGDTVIHDGPLTLSMTMFGEIPVGQALFRTGSQVGDRLFVTGSIGNAALGLDLLQGRIDSISMQSNMFLTSCYHVTDPRLSLGQKLQSIATAMIDVSDGLVQDASHLCRNSQVGAEITLEHVPLSDAAKEVLNLYPQLIKRILAGGDDYELLFTAPERHIAELNHLSTELKVPITCIGRITKEPNVVVKDPHGKEVVLESGGYVHKG